jgi:hypothetical protein
MFAGAMDALLNVIVYQKAVQVVVIDERLPPGPSHMPSSSPKGFTTKY